jgi:hypothetical protein
MLASMLAAARFWLSSTRGHRLRPWRSPYLRWRLETYTGKPAKELGARDFFQFAWRERRQVRRFLRWLDEMHDLPPKAS